MIDQLIHKSLLDMLTQFVSQLDADWAFYIIEIILQLFLKKHKT